MAAADRRLQASHQIVQMILARDRHQLRRCSSVEAFSEIASFGRTSACPSSSIFGMMPEVETVIRFSRHADPVGIGQKPGGLQHVGQIEQRLAHAHHHDVEALESALQTVFARDDKDLADDLAGGEIAFQPHQRRQAKLAIHRAPTWLEMQIVFASSSGISTVSTVRSSLRRSR